MFRSSGPRFRIFRRIPENIVSPCRADASKVKEHAAAMIEGVPGTRIDYLEIVDAETMQPVAENRKPALMAAAVYFGDVRLIDNIEL